MLREWIIRLRGFLRPSPDETELHDEMRAHLDMEVAELVRRGMAPEAARREALLRAGGLTQAEEAVRDQRGVPWLANLSADWRFAYRALTRARAFSAMVILTLALGLGANTAIFSVVRAVLLKPLPHEDGDRLVYLRQTRDGGENLAFSVPEVREVREGVAALGEVAELSNWTVTMQRTDVTERIPIALVSGNWFRVMGLHALLGRVTDAGNDGPGAAPVAVLTYNGWMKHFGGDASVVGRTVRLDGKPTTVIGVLQPAPFFPGNADALANLVLSEHHMSATMVEGRTHRMTEVVARLAPGATNALAQTQLSAVFARLRQAYPDAYPAGSNFHTAVVPFKAVLGERAELTLWLLMSAAAFVLIIAVANVANLSLMRSVRRQHELVVRASLGAGAGRLRRLLLAENLMLAGAGAALGLLVAWAGVQLLAELASRYSPRAAEVRLDPVCLAFAVTLAFGASLVLAFVGALPGEGNVAALVLSGGRRSSAGRSRQRVQRSLVVVQVAVSVVLLAGAGLLTRTMLRLSDVQTGLRTEEVLSLNVPLVAPSELLRSPDADRAAKVRYDQMRREIAALPGVREAGIGSPGPLRASDVLFEVKAENHPATTGEPPARAELRLAGPEFFDAGGIPMVRGRAFSSTDGPGAALAVVINQALADRLFPGEDPVNRRIAWTGELLKFAPISGDWRTVVGVVANTRDGGLDAVTRPAMYQPFAQTLALGGTLVIRADSGVANLIPSVTRIVRRIAPSAPIEDVRTIAQIRDESVAPRRLNAVLVSSFGILAAFIAMVGIAGVLAFAVSARTNEIGIRMSLGADSMRVQRMIVQEGGTLLAMGLFVGTLGAFVVSGLMRGLLWGVAPNDPLTFVGVTVVLAATGLVACWIPALRAARIDPAVTLRAP